MAAHGLGYAVLDTSDTAAFDRFLQAVYRGLHFEGLTPEQLSEYRAGFGHARSVAVHDSTAAEPETPVATVTSWRIPLSLGDARSIEAWAISLVHVASTHRRRGIARALLEGELRSAHEAGIPIAMLTVSEATIYGRWGFGPAAYSADYRISTRELTVTAPATPGRVHLVEPRAVRPLAPAIAARAHERVGGEVASDDLHWDRAFAISARTASHAPKLRAARYDDEHGDAQGFVLYSVNEHASDFSAHTLTVEHLCAATDDALTALWHFVLDQDLVSTVVAELRPVDEPLEWMVSNPRAVETIARREHLWLRILDVPAALSGRRYAAADSVVLRVSDSLGFATGEWMLTTTPDGAATVTAHAGDPHGA
ncbi:GNAT family N-acetyltransferase, partial [Microcella sp.]|uniref:GNAT family N-acetyltransferase n=1 Tax=Microcella sp. TaxID=1913979 RepID=UPI00299F5E23